MSFKAVTWAFDEVVGLSQGEKLVLLALAEFANDDNETWRSREAIAQRALCSIRSVATHLKALELRGLVSRQGRYAWCEDTSAECANRGKHKHRVGTLYKLHLDVTGAGGSTHANSASVENCPECRGSGHTCKICTCGGDEGSTHAKSRSPHMQPVAGITNRNYPPIKPPPSPQPPTGAVGDRDGMGRKVENLPGLGAAGGSAAAREGGPALGLSSEQVSLLVSSLPDSMCVLSAEGMARVWRSLAPRLAAGWSPHQVRRQLAMRTLPSEVRDMAALAAARLDDLLAAPVDARAAGRAATAARVVERELSAAERAEDERVKRLFADLRARHPDWTHAQVARAVISQGHLAEVGDRSDG